MTRQQARRAATRTIDLPVLRRGPGPPGAVPATGADATVPTSDPEYVAWIEKFKAPRPAGLAIVSYPAIGPSEMVLSMLRTTPPHDSSWPPWYWWSRSWLYQ